MRLGLLGFGVGVVCGYFLDGAVSVRRKDRAAVHALIPADDLIDLGTPPEAPWTYVWADAVAELWGSMLHPRPLA